LPLVLPVMGANHLERGTKVSVKLGAINLMTLDISGTIIEVRNAAHTGDMDLSEAADDEAEETGVLNIAVDMAETETAAEIATEAAAE
jgi:exoribonuclease II